MNGIARKDWLEFLRDRRFVLMALLVAALGLTAVATSFVRVTAHETDRIATEARDRETWEAQGERNPHSVAHFATWALRPQTPLSLLDPGVTPYAGAAVWMEAHNQNPARARPIEDSTGAIDLGSFSIAWVLQYILSLLIAVIAAGAVARERERGTLRLMLVNGADAVGIVRRKAASVGRITTLIALPLLGIGLVAAAFAGPFEVTRLMLWTFAYLVFAAIIVAIAVSVSARSRSTSQAILILIGLWLFAFLLVPRAGAGLAEAVVPQPSGDALFTQMQTEMDKEPDIWGGDGAKAYEAGIMRQYGVSRMEDLPVNIDGLRLEESERQGNVVFDRNFGALAATYAAQRNVLRLANLISPLPALQNVSMALAGTDIAHQLAFQEQAEAHRRKLVTQLNVDMIENAGDAGFDYKTDEKLWQKTPDFRFAKPTVGAALNSVWVDGLILLVWLVAALALLAAAGRRLGREAL